jgi:hypothetical protein
MASIKVMVGILCPHIEIIKVDYLTLKKKAKCSFEASVDIYQSSRRNIPEDLTFQG